MNVPYYLGRCVHKNYTGSNEFCCDNFLRKNEVFGNKGALGNSKITCNQDQNNIISCNRTNKRDECVKKIMDGESLAVSSKP